MKNLRPYSENGIRELTYMVFTSDIIRKDSFIINTVIFLFTVYDVEEIVRVSIHISSNDVFIICFLCWRELSGREAL